MFENIRTRWQEARAARLKDEFLDASRRLNGFTEQNAEHFAKALDYAYHHWNTKHGAVKDCPLEFRKIAAKELTSQAKLRYDRDIGASYGLALFSFHVEASYLPGEDAQFVYDTTAFMITQAVELVQKLTKST